MKIIKDAVMCQGLGAFALVQFGSTIFIFGDTGKRKAPKIEIIFFQPYGKWFYFKLRGV
jgi:hypothetical protein